MTSFAVMKFGGTSVGSTDRISAVAKKVSNHIKRTGERVVVVVSAMSGETDRLVELSRRVNDNLTSDREYHQLLASGEQVTAALTAMALIREGQKAQSLLAFQLPIQTELEYGQNLISAVNGAALRELLEQGVTPVVAGFQGVAKDRSYTTLGRGGSDNTAVALAAALDSCSCYIYTDVDGVYTAQPSVCRTAKKLDFISYEEMLELAASGAKVLQSRSVSLARKFKVPLIVCSSFSEVAGTQIVEEYSGMEDAVVSGITSKGSQTKLTVRDLPNSPGAAAKLCRAIAATGVIVDMISQSGTRGSTGTVSFTVADSDARTTEEALKTCVSAEMPKAQIDVDRGIAKLTVVGEGMRNHSGIAAEIFETLGQQGVNIEMITTSEIAVCVAIQEKYSELAVRALHEHFIEKRE